MTAKIKTSTPPKATTQPPLDSPVRKIQSEPETITFTKEDRKQLRAIVDFLLAMCETFELNEIGHSIEYCSVVALISPAHQQAEQFYGTIWDRFKDAEEGGAK